MACIILKSERGERLINENEPYRLAPGEKISGVDYDCGPQFPGDTGPDVRAELDASGIAWGDAVAWVTKRLGIRQCAPCKARQEILNQASQIGWAETMKQIKDTL